MRKVLVKFLPVLVAVIALGMLSGCASVCGVKPEAPAPPPVKKFEGVPAPVTEKPAPAPELPTTYTVEKCDDLWAISSKPQIYGDAWLWPLIYDANKAKIADANKLAVGTVLDIPRDVSDADKAAARAKAQKFPKYVPPADAKRYCPPK